MPGQVSHQDDNALTHWIIVSGGWSSYQKCLKHRQEGAHILLMIVLKAYRKTLKRLHTRTNEKHSPGTLGRGVGGHIFIEPNYP